MKHSLISRDEKVGQGRLWEAFFAGYDYLILFKTGSAQNFMPGTLVAYGYGIPIAIFALLLLVLLIYGIVKAVRYLRKR